MEKRQTKGLPGQRQALETGRRWHLRNKKAAV